MTDDFDESPWTESQWEAFMKRADLRSARFGELLETLRDDPDHEDKIDREIGWDRRRRRRDPEDLDDDADRLEPHAVDEEALAEADQEIKESDRALRKIAAYSFALRAERQVRAILERYLDKPEEEDNDERWGKIWIGSAIAAAKIAGGHGMGYDDDVLCGNIVNVRRGLDALREAIVSTQELHAEKRLSAVETRKLLKILTDLHTKVETWIAELRARVWWE